jgi:hypothetical protein
MKDLITLIMIALVWVSSVTFAMSQSGEAKEKKAHDAFQTLLMQADKNKDGKISMASNVPPLSYIAKNKYLRKFLYL